MFTQNKIINSLVFTAFLTSLISTLLLADELSHDYEINNFDGNGYYFPTSQIPELRSTSLQYIQLLTPDASSKKDQLIKVFATYRNRQTTRKLTYECKRVLLDHGKLSMICASPLQINLSIEAISLIQGGSSGIEKRLSPKKLLFYILLLH